MQQLHYDIGRQSCVFYRSGRFRVSVRDRLTGEAASIVIVVDRLPKEELFASREFSSLAGDVYIGSSERMRPETVAALERFIQKHPTSLYAGIVKARLISGEAVALNRAWGTQSGITRDEYLVKAAELLRQYEWVYEHALHSHYRALALAGMEVCYRVQEESAQADTMREQLRRDFPRSIYAVMAGIDGGFTGDGWSTLHKLPGPREDVGERKTVSVVDATSLSGNESDQPTQRRDESMYLLFVLSGGVLLALLALVALIWRRRAVVSANSSASDRQKGTIQDE